MPLQEFIPGRGESSLLSRGRRAKPRNHAHRKERTVAPSVEPITLAEFKTYAKVEHSDDDTLIEDTIIPTAREIGEEETRRAFITQTWEMYLDEIPVSVWLEIPRPPLQTTDFKIETFDDAGAATLFAATSYVVSVNRMVGRVTLAESSAWPSASNIRSADAMRITFKAGYGAAGSAVPQGLRMALLKAALELYVHREDVCAKATGKKLPYNSGSLWDKWRVPKL